MAMAMAMANKLPAREEKESPHTHRKEDQIHDI